jgi:general secretion pathway protein G
MKTRKQSITLMEIMIVIFLIGLIAGVIGYNMKGSLDEGKAFRTQAGIDQLRDILLLEAAKNNIPVEIVAKDPEFYIQQSGITKNPEKLLKDGWGANLKITASVRNQDLEITSSSLKAHNNKKKKQTPASKDNNQATNEKDTSDRNGEDTSNAVSESR